MINNIYKKYRILRYDRGADGEINLASFCSSGVSCRPQKMLKHLQLHSIMKDFIGALGVLNYSKDTLRVLLFAVALGCLEFVHLQPLSGLHYITPPFDSPLHTLTGIYFLFGKTPSASNLWFAGTAFLYTNQFIGVFYEKHFQSFSNFRYHRL